MLKECLSLLVAVTLTGVVSAQEDAPAESTTADTEVVADDEIANASPGDNADADSPTGSAEIEDAAEEDPGTAVFDEAFEEIDLDEQTYEEDDDDFVPTEEIPADEPIPFPSNI